MQLGDERESENVEDRRGGGGGFGGGGGLNLGVAGGGIGAVVIVVVGLLLGVDPMQLLSAIEGDGPQQTQQEPRRPPAQPGQGGGQREGQTAGNDDAQRRFVAQVLATTEDSWRAEFQRHNRQYTPPQLVLYSGATQSGCGAAQSSTGPFYCPEDRKVYLDLSFFRDMEQKLGAPGDFARAYVIAHEIGHHIQTLLGIMQRVDRQRGQGDRAANNALSVQVELQADCYAGIWANQTNRVRHFMEPGDFESGIGAAAAVGDDRLQMRSRGYVVPESFTHGSSAQRVRWFRRGFDSGDVEQCDTFRE